jgi:hypothetical protein
MKLKSGVSLIIFLVIAIAIALILYSCQDSLCIEKNILKTLIPKKDTTDTTHHPPPTIEKIVPDSMSFTFKEILINSMNYFDKDTIKWKKNEIRKVVKLDTTTSPPTIWLDYSATNTDFEREPSWRKEHVKKIQIKIDSVSAFGYYEWHHSRLSSTITVEKLSPLTGIVNYSAFQTSFKLVLTENDDIFNKDSNVVIRGNLFTDVPSESMPFKLYFVGDIYISYKKK